MTCHNRGGGEGGALPAAPDQSTSRVECVELPDKPHWSWLEGVSEVQDEATEFFAVDLPHQVHLTIDKRRWAYINDNAIVMDEERNYSIAELKMDGTDLGVVAIRPKGGVGSLRGCFDEKGEQTCNKLSYKLKFPKAEREKKFWGLSRLNLNSSTNDDSMLREHLAYGLYARMGVKTPRTSFAEVYVNSELLGLFVVVEQVDERFLESRFPSYSEGNLYKSLWPSGTPEKYFDRALRTNENEASHSPLVQFNTELSSASELELPRVVEKWMNIQTLDAMVAVDEALNHWDGPVSLTLNPEHRHLYSNHNFYLYQSGRERFEVIPWDLDNSFFRFHNRYKAMPSARNLDVDCEKNWSVVSDDGTKSYLVPACEVVYRGLALSGHEQAEKDLVEEVFSLSEMLDVVDWNRMRLTDAIRRDPTIKYTFWRDRVDTLEDDIRFAYARYSIAVSARHRIQPN